MAGVFSFSVPFGTVTPAKNGAGSILVRRASNHEPLNAGIAEPDRAVRGQITAMGQCVLSQAALGPLVTRLFLGPAKHQGFYWPLSGPCQIRFQEGGE